MQRAYVLALAALAVLVALVAAALARRGTKHAFTAVGSPYGVEISRELGCGRYTANSVVGPIIPA